MMKNSTDSRIEIAFASDENYFQCLFVAACSVAANVTGSICFHILDGGISKKSKIKLESRTKELCKNSAIIWHDVTSRIINFPVPEKKRMMYARFLLPELLPQEQFVIYYDVDILCLADVRQLWNQRDSNLVLQGCLDTPPFIPVENKWAKENALIFSASTYICSGLCLYNLERFRNENIVEKCWDFLQEYPNVVSADQSVINYVLGDRISLLQQCWNYYDYLPFNTIQDDNPDVVYHYVGGKPWREFRNDENRFFSELLWHRFNAFACKKTMFDSFAQFFGRIHALMMILCLYSFWFRRIQLWIMKKLKYTGRMASFYDAISTNTAQLKRIMSYLKHIRLFR